MRVVLKNVLMDRKNSKIKNYKYGDATKYKVNKSK